MRQTDMEQPRQSLLSQEMCIRDSLIPLGLVAWYFAGMLLNSIRLGIQSVFGADSDQIKSIWVVNPFVNFAAVFTPTGLATIAVGALMFCLITKKGYHWFSGYKYTRDKRGFDILPNGTHGTSAFMGKKEQEKVLLTGPIQDLSLIHIYTFHPQIPISSVTFHIQNKGPPSVTSGLGM